MEYPLLKIKNLNKTYGRRTILKNINLDLMHGEILGVIGSSGSGKTTLLNAIIGFVNPDSGDIFFRMKSPLGPTHVLYAKLKDDAKAIKNLYGFASQLPSFYEKLTVKENLEYFGKLYNLNDETIEANSETLMKLMNLENSSNVLGKNLSGGMERRLDIACAMMHNPKILILDEPTADLDPVMRNNIWNLIEKINRKGTTVILSSHHLNELETLCTRIAILKEGKMLGVASAQELKETFYKDEAVKIQTYPGKYHALGEYLMNLFPHQIKKFSVSENELLLACPKPQEVLNELMKAIKRKNERIIEIKIVHPTLDYIFMNISDAK